MLTFATARTLSKARSLISELQLHEACIALNGSLIATKDSPAMIWQIDPEVVETLINIGHMNGVSPFLLGLDGESEVLAYGQFKSVFESEFIEKRSKDPWLRMLQPIRPPEKVLTVIYLGTVTTIKGVGSIVRETLGSRVEIKVANDPYIEGAVSLEILHPRGDKVHALEYVLREKGITWDGLTYFGDNLNDVAIGRMAGRCIGVANSVPEFASVFDLVLNESNDEDAVAKFLYHEFEELLSSYINMP